MSSYEFDDRESTMIFHFSNHEDGTVIIAYHEDGTIGKLEAGGGGEPS